MNKNLYVVLMAGGVGVRFWPYSRNSKPKQFLDVLGTGKTLLQSTLDRYLAICPKENFFVVTNVEHSGHVKEQLPMLTDAQILGEPIRKNTAPCIAYACQKIYKQNPDAIVVVSPSDHLIQNEKEFQDTIIKSVEQAKGQDMLITLGIKPTRPETGYGYIQYIDAKQALKKVKTFTEKPELALAKKFVESGEFVWNSGIFIWSVKAILAALEKHTPELAENFAEAATQFDTPNETKAVEAAYMQCRSVSIDFGVMEKATNVYVWLSQFAWSDLGTWASLHDASIRDEHNNVLHGDVMTYDTRNSFIKGPKDKLMVVQGLNGYLVGWFNDVLVVCEKDKEELFKRFVNDLKAKGNGAGYL
jgi:mannose-1-phosphate guanylyltransferase